MNNGVFHNLHILKSPCVLFMDFNGWWCPLANLYFSSSSQILVSRHPESCIQEIISHYCPQCLTRYLEEEVKTYKFHCPSCFKCPCCYSVLSIIALNSTECAFQCGLCTWNSEACGLKGGDKSELEVSLVERERNENECDVFKGLLNSLEAVELNSNKPTIPLRSSSKSLSLSESIWKLEDIEKKIATLNPYNPKENNIHYSSSSTTAQDQAKLGELDNNYLSAVYTNHFSSLSQRLYQVSTQPRLVTELLPLRFDLKSKRTIRCRQDVDEGKFSILVQPKTFPLEGDSSQKQRGKWWGKDASAIHDIPLIILTKVPNKQEILSSSVNNINVTSDSNMTDTDIKNSSPIPYIRFEISNPKDFPIIITIKQLRIPLQTNSIKDISISTTSSADTQIAEDTLLEMNQNNNADRGQIYDKFSKHPPFSVRPLSLYVTGDVTSIEFTLDEYEEELLKDDTTTGDSSILLPGTWSAAINSNSATVQIPVTLSQDDLQYLSQTVSQSLTAEQNNSVVMELLLVMSVRERDTNAKGTSSFSIHNLPIRIAFPGVC